MPQDQQSSAQLVPQSSQLVASSSSQLTGAARTSGSRASGQSSRFVPGPDGATFNQFNQQNLLHHTLNQNTLNQTQHNVLHQTVDPQQLEQLVEAAGQYRVEVQVSQMRESMNAQLARIEMDHQARLKMAEDDSRIAFKRMHDEGSQQLLQVQHERDLAVQQMSVDAHQLQQAQHEVMMARQAEAASRAALQQMNDQGAHRLSQVQQERDLAIQQLGVDAQQLQQAQHEAELARQSEGRVVSNMQSAGAQFAVMAADNQRLTRQLAAAQQQLAERKHISSASSVAGSPCRRQNPFDTPAIPSPLTDQASL